ncbi:hypothetical protein [Herbaspirillum aquaticum]|uniref:hypothetical protein n=1 Tax=Herbaspirillum aquaticum TaxID=568783 RepID=UPI0024DE175E|nr:hypothetical protein [Herbaspirillum aquaticum]
MRRPNLREVQITRNQAIAKKRFLRHLIKCRYSHVYLDFFNLRQRQISTDRFTAEPHQGGASKIIQRRGSCDSIALRHT